MTSDCTYSAKEIELSDGKTIAERIIDATATIEKISFRKFERVTKSDDDAFGIHMGGIINAIVVINGTNEEIAKDATMQICAMLPIAVNRDAVSAEIVAYEK